MAARVKVPVAGATWLWIAMALIFTWALAAIVYDFGLAGGAWPPAGTDVAKGSAARTSDQSPA